MGSGWPKMEGFPFQTRDLISTGDRCSGEEKLRLVGKGPSYQYVGPSSRARAGSLDEGTAKCILDLWTRELLCRLRPKDLKLIEKTRSSILKGDTACMSDTEQSRQVRLSVARRLERRS